MAKEKKKVAPMGINLSIAQRPFVEALLISNDGEELCEASDELKRLVKAIEQHGGKGHVTVKVAVASGPGRKRVISVDISAKVPKAQRNKTGAFADDNGYLGLFDPDQFEMDFSEKETSTAGSDE